MSTKCVKSQYYSGQGALLLGLKDGTTGEILGGLRPVGNVSALQLGIATTEFEHKESCSGTRGVDLTLNTEINVSLNFTLECLNRKNLALVLNGSETDVTAGTVTDEAVASGHDYFTPLAHIGISAVVVTDVGGATTYTEDTDYTVDAATGMICVLSTGAITDGQALEVDYAYGAYDNIEGFTSAANPIRWARFVGLNTALDDLAVVVDVYKVSVTPLAALDLINDEIAQMAITAKALSDTTRGAGESAFFTVKQAQAA